MTFKPNIILKNILSNQLIILSLLFIISLLISIQNISLGVNNFWGGHYTHYNNFLIFKYSFSHLIENKNLYDFYFNEYADLYKYSPTFALIMGLFYYLPDSLGLFIWNSLNIFVLYYAIFSLKSINSNKKSYLVMFLLFELILSTQNSQCNALIAGLTIIAFNLLEKGKNMQAGFFIVLGAFIKIYSIVGCLLFLFYPNKIKSFLNIGIWLVAFFLLPLIFINFSTIIWQYKNWYVLLKTDQNESIGMSLFAFTQKLFPLNYFKSITQLFGILALLAPLLNFKQFSSQLFRLKYISLILIWMVVFNYKAESPTYVIAMSGIGIWFFASKKSNLTLALFILTLIFTSIWFTDIVPNSIKKIFFDLKYVKSLFPIIILFVIFYELLLSKNKNKDESSDLKALRSE